MKTITSKDGTRIAYDETGTGQQSFWSMGPQRLEPSVGQQNSPKVSPKKASLPTPTTGAHEAKVVIRNPTRLRVRSKTSRP